jgi:hypothetical protein
MKKRNRDSGMVTVISIIRIFHSLVLTLINIPVKPPCINIHKHNSIIISYMEVPSYN